jgi:hypothetical protein
MSDLFSINNITFFNQEAKCQTCLYYKIIKHLNERFLYKDGDFVRMDMNDHVECFLLDQIFAGVKLKDRDYEKLNGCEVYVEQLTWDGVTEEFVKGIGSIINYIFLSSNIRVSVDDIFEVVGAIDEKNFSTATKTVDRIEDQFIEEKANYRLFEEVRRRIVVGDS